eukprot:GFYU01000861.1.p1 GENE.GFYU01000861.1~~GFYU01000861.1.p1  ORF type:complete len:517 (-),score=178.09 GFYU01000861.1:47-1552(-)
MGKDVEMKDAPVEGDKKDENKEETKEPVPEKVKTISEELAFHVALLQKAVSMKETRYLHTILRSFTTVRRRINKQVLTNTIKSCFPEAAAKRATLLSLLDKCPDPAAKMEVEGEEAEVVPEPTTPPKEIIAEVESYLQLLLVVFLIDNTLPEEARTCSCDLVEMLQGINRRTLNPIAAKAWFYYSRSHELTGTLSSIRPVLLAAHRTATLRHDEICQAVLLNLLLRNYLAYNLVDQADKLVSKTSFPSSANNQYARYLYYVGKIKAIQLEYSDGHNSLLQAIRKAPQAAARGFRLTVHKLFIIVQLLMGDIPERAIFYQNDLKVKLQPYLELVRTVRVGDLQAFQAVVTKYEAQFKQDGIYTLILRLRQNVIKVGLRKINLTYSRISLEDICKKLKLESIEDTTSIVSKAIRDGVIEATIDHDKGFLQCKELADVYSTLEPQGAFHKRIGFCLNIHNEAVRAMRYPPDAHKEELEDAKARRQREQQEQELAQNLADDDEEF